MVSCSGRRCPLISQWAQTEKANKSAIQEHKIKVTYLPPEGGVATHGIPEEEEAQDASRVDDSVCSLSALGTRTLTEQALFAAAPSSPHVNGDSLPVIARSEAPSSSLPTVAETPALTGKDSKPSTSAERGMPALSAADVQSSGSPTNAALEQSLSATTSDQEKLQVAMAEVDRLKKELDQARGPQATGLRKRGGASTA